MKKSIPSGVFEDVDEKKAFKFKLKQFKHLKPKKKKKGKATAGGFTKYSDTSKGFSFLKSKGSSGYVGAYNSYMPEAAVLQITDVDQWTTEIYKGLKAGWGSVSKSTLGGDKNVAIMIKLTIEPEKDWPNKILQNARFAMIRIATDGTMEMFASHRNLKNMRKTKVKSAKDVVNKINTWIKKVDEEVVATRMPMQAPFILDEEDEDEGYGGTEKWKKGQKKLKRSGVKLHRKDKFSGYTEGAKSHTGYELYHKDFSSAMQHAYDHAKTKGFIVDPKEIDDKVATGPKKPSKGKTNRYELKAGRKTVHIQVANLDNKRYELNMYIEGFELPTFSMYITEGRAKQTDDAFAATTRDLAKMRERLIDTQKKLYSIREIEGMARKYKQKLIPSTPDEPNPVGGKTWDGDWLIDLQNGITMEYQYGPNSTYIKGWKFNKAKMMEYIKKWGSEKETLRDYAPIKGKVVVGGFENAFELIGEEFQLTEEVPANATGVNVVGTGDDPTVWTRKKKRKNAKVETENFGGRKVFVVSPQRYFDSRLGKSRYDRYEKYVGNDKLGEAIRQYGRNNPKNSIILKNSGNGAMLYLKYGRK